MVNYTFCHSPLLDLYHKNPGKQVVKIKEHHIQILYLLSLTTGYLAYKITEQQTGSLNSTFDINEESR